MTEPVDIYLDWQDRQEDNPRPSTCESCIYAGERHEWAEGIVEVWCEVNGLPELVETAAHCEDYEEEIPF